MNVIDALQTVLDLARQNIVDYRDDPDAHVEQTEACEIVETTIEEMQDV